MLWVGDYFSSIFVLLIKFTSAKLINFSNVHIIGLWSNFPIFPSHPGSTGTYQENKTTKEAILKIKKNKKRKLK